MKIKVDLGTGILLFILSIILLILPIYNINNLSNIVRYLFLAYGIINLGRFIILRKTKDFEGLFTAILSMILFIVTFFINVTDSNLTLALFIFAFVAGMAFIRLKKADYYHDRQEKIWLLEITTLIVFVLSGFLTALNIILSKDSNLVMIGLLFFINGFIEIIDPIVNSLKK